MTSNFWYWEARSGNHPGATRNRLSHDSTGEHWRRLKSGMESAKKKNG